MYHRDTRKQWQLMSALPDGRACLERPKRLSLSSRKVDYEKGGNRARVVKDDMRGKGGIVRETMIVPRKTENFD